MIQSRIFQTHLLAVIAMIPIAVVPCAVGAEGKPALLDVKLISHRGLHGAFPENSIAAIQSLLQKGIHGAEIDLRTTKDGHIVLMHDERLERTTTGKGLVRETRWEDIRKLNLKRADGSPTPHGIPDYRAALLAVKKHPYFELALDLKSGFSPSTGLRRWRRREFR